MQAACSALNRLASLPTAVTAASATYNVIIIIYLLHHNSTGKQRNTRTHKNSKSKIHENIQQSAT